MKLINWKWFKFLSDKTYLKIKYFRHLKRQLNLSSPTTFNEKLQWLKLYDRKDIYTKMVDKYEAKEYVAGIIGQKHIIPTLGIYESFDEIDFKKLPKQFVIKCTHDCGSVIIVKDKTKMDLKRINDQLTKALKNNYYYSGREWPYKNVKPRIIVEKYMKDNESSSMRDYKFFCFDGKPEIMYISEGMSDHNTASMSFFDMNFKLIDCKRKDYKLLDYMPQKPKTFEQMKKLAGILSKGIPHLRVDFYEINGEVYFGELTFSTNSGFIPFESEVWDKKLGDLIDLNGVKKHNEK